MRKTTPPAAPRYRFDFEIGLLIKSPCKGCKVRPSFPKCMENCRILDRLHAILAETVSCSRNR